MMMKIKATTVIILMAALTFCVDLAIGYGLVWLWFKILNPGIIQIVLIILTFLSTGKYALGQIPWAIRKIREAHAEP